MKEKLKKRIKNWCFSENNNPHFIVYKKKTDDKIRKNIKHNLCIDFLITYYVLCLLSITIQSILKFNFNFLCQYACKFCTLKSNKLLGVKDDMLFRQKF